MSLTLRAWPPAGLPAMSAAARARQSHAPPFIDPPGYGRHRPERTLLCQLAEQHYPAFRALRAAAERPLPDFVQQEFEAAGAPGKIGSVTTNSVPAMGRR
jgi:hypothetical protein